MKKEHFKEGEIIFEDQSTGNSLYLLYKGKVQVLKDNKVLRELDKGSCFGEISLLLNQPHTATIKASTKVSLYTLSSDNFFKNMDKNILEFLIYKISLQDNFLTNLENLYFIKSIGEGKFGSVSLVHNEKYQYAIKAVCRKSAEQQRILIKYFLKERSILLKLDHPLVVKLVKTMKNDNYIFYLMEYVNGIVLSKYLENRLENRIRNKYETQFYVASILLVVDYLNSKSIAHRDLKPDNTMIDEKGYLKVIDFGTSVIIKDFTSTITGTPHYIAPEVLLGRGYSFSADYWSIGILAFEIYFNYYPFGNKATDPMEVYKDVIKKYKNFFNFFYYSLFILPLEI
jgi:cGMP-dependent protein kinase